MSQTFNTFSNATLIGELDDRLNENFATLRTLFSGTSAPASPATYQLWLDTSGATPRLKAYTGAAWIDITDWLYSFQTVSTELAAARGSASSLDARLDVALNEDGTLKAGMPAGGWWATEADAIAFNDASSFTVAGDKTAVYTARRAVHLDQTADAYGHVASSSHLAGTTTVTVDCTVDAGLTGVEYGQPVENDTAIPLASATVQGKVELATDAETQTGTDTERAITPANLSARTATDARTGIAELATAVETRAGSDAARIVTPATGKFLPLRFGKGGMRQTVLSGGVDANGYADFLTEPVANTIRLNASASDPFVVSAALGFDANGAAVDLIGVLTADVDAAMSGLSINTTYYLYVQVAETGTVYFAAATKLTTGSGAWKGYLYVAPGYPGGTSYYFDLNLMRMMQNTGAGWVPYYDPDVAGMVLVGEFATDGSGNISSVTTYALRGQYDSDWFAVANATLYTKSHNIGVAELAVECWFRESASYGSCNMVFEQIDASNKYGGEWGIASRTAVKLQTASLYCSPFFTLALGAGSANTLVAGQCRFVCRRAW